MNSFIISLNNLRFFSRIGVFGQERVVGNEISVDCHVSFPAEGFRQEELASTISYAEIHDIIREIMEKEWLLLESVAVAISERCRSRWPHISTIKVKITKIAPPITGIQGNCAVEYIDG